MLSSHSSVDRQDATRKDPVALKALWQDAKTRVIPIFDGHGLVTDDVTDKRMVWSPVQPTWSFENAIFLGTTADAAWFAINVSDDEFVHNSVDATAKFVDLRTALPHLNAQDGALLVYAKGLCFWHKRVQFCNYCSAPLSNKLGGHVKQCKIDSCAQQIFPRTDPAVIMLVIRTDEAGVEHCLLGRSAIWPKGMYSTLAGFVESGESLEHAVAREVREEADIIVDSIEYVASQPWPFPRSIMLGFEARAVTEKITLDRDELEDAQWFTREDLAAFGKWGEGNSTYQMPRRDSIAHFLIQRWLTR